MFNKLDVREDFSFFAAWVMIKLVKNVLHNLGLNKINKEP